MSDNAIALSQVSYRYPSQSQWLLDSYQFTVPRGTIFSIMGTNGRGKTTLLKLLLGTLKPATGQVTVNGSMAFVPQLQLTHLPYRVLDIVLMGRAKKMGLFSLPSAEDHDVALNALERLGLTALAHTSFDTLSGGQRQLVIFARALASGADILILDEPTSALDLQNQHLILRWMTRLARDAGLTVIFTTHQPQHAWHIADRVLLIRGGQDYQIGPTRAVLTEENLYALYGVHLKEITYRHHQLQHSTLVPVF